MEPLKVLAICGSLRSGSFNRKALQLTKRIAAEAGAKVEEVDPGSLPLYNADLEGSLPEPVRAFKSAVEKADVLLIASPEYNYSVPGVLKNAIDWASRGGNSFSGKFAAIFGASNGPFGTVRGQFHLRQVLTAVNVFILPQPQVLIRTAQDAFDESGDLKDPKLKDQLHKLVGKTLEWAGKMKG